MAEVATGKPSIWRDPRIRAWLIYDASLGPFNAFFCTIVFSSYFGEELVRNPARTDELWGMANSLAACFVGLSSLFLGPLIDRRGWRRGFFRYTALAWMTLAVLALVPTHPIPALLFYVFALVHNQWNSIPYNAYLNDLAPLPERGRLSGIGWSMGYAWNLVLMGVAALILMLHWPADTSARLTLALVCLSSFLLFLPAARHMPVVAPTRSQPLRELAKGSVLIFLFAAAIYMDGVATFIDFAGLYARQSMHLSYFDLIVLFLVLEIFAVAGALASSVLGDRFGDRLGILGALVAFVFVSICMRYVHERTTYYALCALGGVGLGLIGAGSRALLSRILPADRLSAGYALFAVSMRAGALVGPWLFGWVSAHYGQRLASFTTVPFFVVGGLLLLKVKPTPIAIRE